MQIESLKYIIFVSILFYVPLWSQINLFISGIGKSKKATRLIEDKWINSFLKKKAETDIKYTKVINSNLLFGMMVGIPKNPQLMLSKKLYKNFTKIELEYVILHEAGHYKLGHSIIELSAGLVFLILGIFTINILHLNTIPTMLLGLFFGILMIQLGRFEEIQADNFSLKRMNNPNGMISATKKFSKAWEDKSSNNSLIRLLFYRKNSYENRIKMANSEIESRKNKYT